MKASPGIGALLDQQMEAAQKLHRSMLLKQKKAFIFMYLARQVLAVRGHEQIEGSLIQLLLLRGDLLLYLLLLYFTHTHLHDSIHQFVTIWSRFLYMYFIYFAQLTELTVQMQAYEELERKVDPFNSKVTIIHLQTCFFVSPPPTNNLYI